MDLKICYLILLIFNLLSIIFPILGKKKNSLELSTFFMSMGYGGYGLSKGREHGELISREEYLDKSLKLQGLFIFMNTIYIVGAIVLDAGMIGILIMMFFGSFEVVAFWKNIKKYSIK